MDINDTISKYEFMIQFISIDLISHPPKIKVQQIHDNFHTKQFVHFLIKFLINSLIQYFKTYTLCIKLSLMFSDLEGRQNFVSIYTWAGPVIPAVTSRSIVYF